MRKTRVKKLRKEFNRLVLQLSKKLDKDQTLDDESREEYRKLLKTKAVWRGFKRAFVRGY